MALVSPAVQSQEPWVQGGDVGGILIFRKPAALYSKQGLFTCGANPGTPVAVWWSRWEMGTVSAAGADTPRLKGFFLKQRLLALQNTLDVIRAERAALREIWTIVFLGGQLCPGLAPSNAELQTTWCHLLISVSFLKGGADWTLLIINYLEHFTCEADFVHQLSFIEPVRQALALKAVGPGSFQQHWTNHLSR